MENFNLGGGAPVSAGDKKPEELHMSVSPICEKNGQKCAYVSFSDGVRSAEGEIPDCKITKNDGFSEEEAVQLELYMKGNLLMLKKMASGVNVFSAFMGKDAKK